MHIAQLCQWQCDPSYLSSWYVWRLRTKETTPNCVSTTASQFHIIITHFIKSLLTAKLLGKAFAVVQYWLFSFCSSAGYLLVLLIILVLFGTDKMMLRVLLSVHPCMENSLTDNFCYLTVLVCLHQDSKHLFQFWAVWDFLISFIRD